MTDIEIINERLCLLEIEIEKLYSTNFQFIEMMEKLIETDDDLLQMIETLRELIK